MWEIQVIDKDNSSLLFGINCDYSYIKYGKEIFKWTNTDQYFNIDVYFNDYNPKISRLKQDVKNIIYHAVKKINVVIKSSILGVEELECFKNYCKLITSIYKEIDESNLS